MKSNERMRYGFAKVEFIAQYEKIKKMAEDGFTKKSIYDTLAKKGLINMAYRTFIRFMGTAQPRATVKK